MGKGRGRGKGAGASQLTIPGISTARDFPSTAKQVEMNFQDTPLYQAAVQVDLIKAQGAALFDKNGKYVRYEDYEENFEGPVTGAKPETGVTYHFDGPWDDDEEDGGCSHTGYCGKEGYWRACNNSECTVRKGATA